MVPLGQLVLKERPGVQELEGLDQLEGSARASRVPLELAGQVPLVLKEKRVRLALEGPGLQERVASLVPLE